MVKYVIEYSKADGTKASNTFEKLKKAESFIEMAFAFGIDEIKIKKFTITEK